MQALMLAAGMGRRMGKYTKDHTKCMLKVGERTLLERVVDSLKAAGIGKLVLVVGYEAQTLRQYAESCDFGLEIEYVCNPDYETTNNIYSLYLAREQLMADDTILLESDLIFDTSILPELMRQKEQNLVVAAKYEQWMDGTVLILDKHNNILDFVDKSQFRYADAGQYYKTVNIYKFSRQFSESKYVPFLEAYLKAYGTNQYYEQVLKILSHIRGSELKAYILNEEKWYEIDDSQDLDIADTMFASDDKILKKYELHYGGYWRFPRMKDFCYLVNPYYPPAQMLDQMKNFFGELITQYPSGMSIQKLNASRILGIDEEQLLVGNGAAELINVLGKTISGTMSVCVPTFHEYIRCFSGCDIRRIKSSRYGYQYSTEALLKEIDHTQWLFLINPDNPSGSFLTREETLRILNKCEEKGVHCIIDESFIDFADRKVRFTLLSDRLIRKYPHMVVIKSISKCYGVPGLRLGVMATSDRRLLKEMQDRMAIWNINSFAEYYLQIQRLYRRDYVEACDRVGGQRAYLQSGLKEIDGIEAYPSQANFILCKLTGGVASKDFVALLLKRYNILLKDLSAKAGFGKEPFIRIAVKDEESNRFLLEAMKETLASLEEHR